MKKSILFTAVAAAMLTSCSSDEMLQESKAPEAAIGFTAFTNNATRGVSATTSTSFTQFLVWGGMANDPETVTDFGTIFNAQPVNGNNGTWTYTPLRYWVPGNAYSFTALAPTTGGNLPTGVTFATEDVDAGSYLTKYNGVIKVNNGATGMNGNVDLVWCSEKVAQATDNMLPVNLTFQHLLSQVNLKFVNCFPSNGSTIEISNVTVTGLENGTIDFDNYAVGTKTSAMTWTLTGATEERSYKFGPNASSGAFGPAGTSASGASESGYRQTEYWCVMPSQQQVKVNFTATLYSGSVEAGSWDHEYTLLLDADNLNAVFKPGYTYTLVANLDADNIANNPLNPIEFAVVGVEDWQNAGDVDYLYSLTLSNGGKAEMGNTAGASINVNVNTMTPTAWDASEYSALATAGCTYEWTESVPTGEDAIFTITPAGATALPDELTDIKATITLNAVQAATIHRNVLLSIKTADGEEIAKSVVAITVPNN